jgi:hypothetical protein
MMRVIDIPDSDKITDELTAYIDDYIQQNNPSEFATKLDAGDIMDKCPIIGSWFTQNSLSVKNCYLIIAQPNTNYQAHVDGPVGGSDTLSALNFGIHNISKTYTVLYKHMSGEILIKKLPNGVPYKCYSMAKLEEVGRFTLDSPILFNACIPHAVHNPTDKTRVSVSFRFKEEYV